MGMTEFRVLLWKIVFLYTDTFRVDLIACKLYSTTISGGKNYLIMGVMNKNIVNTTYPPAKYVVMPANHPNTTNDFLFSFIPKSFESVSKIPALYPSRVSC